MMVPSSSSLEFVDSASFTVSDSAVSFCDFLFRVTSTHRTITLIIITMPIAIPTSPHSQDLSAIIYTSDVTGRKKEKEERERENE
jgi:hypothetical protein